MIYINGWRLQVTTQHVVCKHTATSVGSWSALLDMDCGACDLQGCFNAKLTTSAF